MKRLAWGGVVVEERPADMTYEAGGSGLWSTVDDYRKFAQVFLSNGEVDGVRFLRSEMLVRMKSARLNQIRSAMSGLSGPIDDGSDATNVRKPVFVPEMGSPGLTVTLPEPSKWVGE
jgi:CubicO group peptidase (beta-lactamase class C family)